MNSKPGGRKAVWLLIAASLIILIAVFVARPRDNGGSSEMVAAGTTNTEVEGSRAPGTLAEAGRPAQQP